MEWLNKYIGIPHDEYNCWQLICKIYSEQFGIDLPTFETEYNGHKDKENIRTIYEREYKRWRKVEKYTFKDIVSLRVMGQPWHAAMVFNQDSMIHCMPNSFSIIERFTSASWKSKILGFYRYAK